MANISEKWQSAFLKTIQHHDNAKSLKEAALYERLGAWTQALTSVAVTTCEAMGWQASAKGHHLKMLPITRSEYLGLDITAFSDSEMQWRFPVAVFELENDRKNAKISYSLWKVLCIRADLRIVFCYRKSSDEGSTVIRYLRDDVIHSMALSDRVNLYGETIVVVGTRDESSTFPYNFFKWWRLDTNTGKFSLF